MVIGSAMIANIRRIQRYLEAKTKLETEQILVQREQDCLQEQPMVSLFVFLKSVFRDFLVMKLRNQVIFGC
jgi:hypothetical protein